MPRLLPRVRVVLLAVALSGVVVLTGGSASASALVRAAGSSGGAAGLSGGASDAADPHDVGPGALSPTDHGSAQAGSALRTAPDDHDVSPVNPLAVLPVAAVPRSDTGYALRADARTAFHEARTDARSPRAPPR